MTLTYTYDGSPLGFPIPPTKLNLPSRAEIGSIDVGGVSPEDTGAALTLTGWRPFVVEESACSQPRIFTGWVYDRGIGRSFDQTQFVGSDERIHDTTLTGLNAIFGMRIIWDTDGNRPEETMDARLAWLLGSDYLSGLIDDTGHVLTGLSLSMDAADYRDGYPDAVLQDLSTRSASLINYFAMWDPTPATGSPRVGLFYNYVGSATYDCTISISNAGDDDGATIFTPDEQPEARLNRSPETVWSDVDVKYKNGSVHVYKDATALAFIRRGTTINKPYIGKQATAISAGQSFLATHDTEVDRITCQITVPASVVGLIQAGMRMPVKFTHMPGYESGTSMVIVAYTPTPTDDHASHYAIALELVAPKVVPNYPLYAVLEKHRANFWACSSPPIWPDGHEMAGWEISDYSIVPPGDPPALTGPVSLVPWATGGSSCVYQGFQITADGTVDLDLAGAYSGVSFGAKDVWVEIRQNGTIIGSYHDVVVDGGLATITVTGLAALAGDIFTVSCYAPDWALFAFGMVPYVWTQTHFKISGTAGGGGGTGGPITPPTGGGTTTHTTDPTVTDDSTHGFAVGDHWINTATGEEFVLVDSTDGAAVWVSTTATGGGSSLTVREVDGSPSVVATELDVPNGSLTVAGTVATLHYVQPFGGGLEVYETIAALGATHTLDLANGNGFDATLTADCTLTFAGATAGTLCSFMLLLRQDGTGGWTMTWPGSVIWAGGTAPTLDTTMSTAAVLTFFTLDGGTTWYGFPTGTSAAVASSQHILLADGHATPFAFTDLLQMDDGSDFMWSD